MKIGRFLPSVKIPHIPVPPVFRALSELLTPVLVVLVHIYACLTLPFYGERPIQTLLVVQFVCLLVLFVLQIPNIDRPWLWVVLLANAIFVPIAASRNRMSRFDMIYAVLLLSLLLFRQIVLPRRVYLAMHLFTAVFLTWFVGISAQGVGSYAVLGHTINPNMFGILALSCMMHWMCWFEMLDVKWGYRLLGQGLALIWGVTYVLQSDCRSALVALTVFLLLLLIYRKPYPPRVHQAISILILAAMAVFPVIYVRLSNNTENMHVLGKWLFSGREGLWSEIFEWIRAHPVFGNGIAFGSSSHHILLELMLCLGIVPCLSFLLLCGRRDRRAARGRTAKVAQAAFLACMMIAFFESFFTDRYLHVLFLSFLLSAMEEDRKEALRP